MISRPMRPAAPQTTSFAATAASAQELVVAPDPLDLGEARQRSGLDLRTGPGGNVINDERQTGRLGDRLVVLEDAFLRGLVVIGRNQQSPVRARLLGALRQPDRLARRIRSRAGDHRDAL